MADNKTASAKTDTTKSNATKTENLPETTTKETLPPSPLHTDHGSTLIAEQVVQKIAGIACREVPGVHAMGSTGRRMLSSITDRIPGSTTNVSNGVQVEKGERQCAIDLSVVIEYGTGLEVVEVNVQVTDVYIQGEDDNDDEQPDQAVSQHKSTELS